MTTMRDRASLAGKVAIVTGSGQGLGRATAIGLAEMGARVAIAEMNEETGPKVEAELSGAGHSSLFVKTDARVPEQVNATVETVLQRWGRLDIMVNNAGGTFFIPALDISPNGFDAVVRENLKSAFLGSQAAAKAMIKNGHGGSIINIASVIALIAGESSAAYGAAKAGITGLTRALAFEWAQYGIRVNAIAPGYIDTEGTRTRGVGRDYGHVPMKRQGQPHEIAGAAVFLASDLASYVTGHVLVVDGGTIIRALAR